MANPHQPHGPARPPIDLAQSLAQVARGGIPLRAHERLAEEAGPHARLFTSDLTVNEFLLARDVQAQPISQVMGSSVYHVGQIADYKGSTGEITKLSEAHREVRRRALARLWQEAALLGADAVIGARLRERMITMGARGKGGDDGGEVLEFTVVGTAVRAPWITHAPGNPVVTDLTGQDLWALAQEGFEPTGFLFDFCRYHVWHVAQDSVQGGELALATKSIEIARNLVAQKVLAQAQKFQSEFVVGSDIVVDIREVPCGYERCERNDLDIDVSWFGTGVRRIPNVARRTHAEVPPLVLSMMPLGRPADERVEAQDDAAEVARAAKDAEEDALEAEEMGR
jgi:uncharacterized protein YbjQ (UPF0145 family)